ncbi:MAG TPA: hypothetical protein PLS24_07900, partial [Sedimentisphaerales bacterium]|nr:hypothetical protein [Sedimentisphaerales bacterium]
SFTSGNSVVLAFQRLPMASTTALSWSNSTIRAGIAKHMLSYSPQWSYASCKHASRPHIGVRANERLTGAF